MMAEVIVVVFSFFSFLLAFKFYIFPKLTFTEHPFGTFCMYSKTVEDQKLTVLVKFNSEEVDITSDSLKYLNYNYAEGHLTSFAHSWVIPKQFLNRFAQFLFASKIHPLLEQRDCSLHLHYSHILSGKEETFTVII
jgi:hypothetical protein